MATTTTTGSFGGSTTTTASTSVLTPLVDTASAGTLSIGTATATGVSIGSANLAETSVGTINAAGTVQANAASLTFASNVVSTGTNNAGVVLPSAPIVGQYVTIYNTDGANTLKIYADSSGTGGTINGGSANAAVTLAHNTGTRLRCISTTGANQWYSEVNG